jgi:hypothetical protein
MNLCNNSSTCKSKQETKKIGNTTVNSCTQCFHIISWYTEEEEVVEEEKIDIKPVIVKTIEAVKAPVIEAAVVKKVDVKEENYINDDEIEKNAKNLRESFKEIDKITVKADVLTSNKSVDLSFDDKDFDEEFDKPILQEAVFEIVDFAIISTTEVALICNNQSSKVRFKVVTTTSEAKVNVIKENPEKIKGKGAKISFTGLDEKNRPVNPEYVGFAKFLKK